MRSQRLDSIMKKSGVHVARMVVVLVAAGLLAGCVSHPRVDASPEPASTPAATLDPALTPDVPLDLAFSQYMFDPAQYPPEEYREGFPLAKLSGDGRVLSFSQIGSPGCEVEPVSFERKEGGVALRITYEFVEPNPLGVCNTVAAHYRTDVTIDEELSTSLRKVIIVGPFGTASEASIYRA